MRRFFLIFSLWLAFAFPIYAVNRPSIKLQLQLSGTHANPLPHRISGTIKIENWTGSDRCLYLPYNNPIHNQGLFTDPHLEHLEKDSRRTTSSESHTEITLSSVPLAQMSSYLYKINDKGLDVAIDFTSTTSGSGSDLFFYGFHPVLLKSCEIDKLPVTRNLYEQDSEIQFTVTYPADEWLIVSPIAPSSQETLIADRLGLVLLDRTIYKDKEVVNGKIRIYFKNEDFLTLIPTIESSIKSHARWFGRFPYPKLNIIESTDREIPDIAGIVSINTPKQPLFTSLQTRILNWTHWATSTLIAHQWYGSAIRAYDADDEWFLKGTVDFVVLKALKVENIRFNLFNVYDLGFSTLSLDYLKGQNLTAALLNRYKPALRLIDENGNSITGEQHSLAFIKHAIALRHLSSLAGEENFQRFFRKFTQNNLYTAIEPSAYLRELSGLPSPFSKSKREGLRDALLTWWQVAGWPDFEVLSFTKERLAAGNWLSRVEIQNLSKAALPVEVAIEDRDGRTYFETTSALEHKAPTTLTFISQAAPTHAEIDPQNHLFDQNRFNNSTRPTAVKFLPGSANTLEEDAYTVVWLPYPIRRPGEEVAIGLQSHVFKYINGSAFVKIEREITSARTGGELKMSYPLPFAKMLSSISFDQNFKGYRTSLLSLERKEVFLPQLDLGLFVGERRIAGENDTRHNTTGLSSSFSQRFATIGCNVQILTETETTPSAFAQNYHYTRNGLRADGSCLLPQKIGFNQRLFWGAVNSGTVPMNALFNPQNLNEAHLRLDIAAVAATNRILSFSSDFLLPIYLPLPAGAMVLKDKLRLLLFYDYGFISDEKLQVKSYGSGLTAAFGGDITGSSALTISRLSLQLILFSDVAGEKNHRPRLIFDLTGEL